nr:ribonuclease H-like domain-containing protein [Tanacetum cinerariifolium]
MLRDNALVELRKKFEKAEQDRDELNLKLEKFQTSSKNLSKLLASQITNKTGLGYDNQVFNSTVFDCDDLLSPESDVSDSEDESEGEPMPTPKEPSFVQPTEHVKTPRSSIKPVKHPIPVENLRKDIPKSKGHRHSWNRKACFVCKSLTYLIKDCDYYEKKMVQKPTRNQAHRRNHQHYARMTHPHPHRHVVPTTVLTRSRLVPLTVARPVTTAIPQTKVPHQRPPNMVNAVEGVKGNWGNPHHALKDKGVIDSCCSRHMTGNISYLFDFEEINGGYAAFGRYPKGGKIIGKGKIKIGKLDFDDVYFVKELKFNPFSVSQMCDKKNSVLFTDTECIVLASDFKLPNDNHVLLRVPRDNNMYNVDLKNIVPSGDLTCLFAKAILDESNLWHRRLGHINFKTMNKVVKGNLVRGLPSKVFKNNHTCVACKKGKQHRAFWSGPTSLFYIDTLTQSMNYQLVVAGNQPNSRAGIQEHFDLGKSREGNVQQYVLFPLWSTSSKDPQNTDADATFEVKKPKSEVHVSLSSSAKTKKHDDKTKREAKGKSHVKLSAGVRNLSEEFEDFSSNSTNGVNAASTPVTVVKPNSTNSRGGKYLLLLELCKAFEKLMKDKFQMSSMGQLTFFLGLKVKQKDDGIFISQDKYVAEILRKFGLTDSKSASTLIDTKKPLLKDPDGEDMDVHIYRFSLNLVAYSDNDYAKTVVATSSTKAEYVGRKFNFSTYIFDSMVTNVDIPSKFLMYLRFLQVMINTQVDDLSSHNTNYTSPALTQKVFAKIMRIGKGFSGVETPLFDTMLVKPQVQDAAKVEEDEDDEVSAAPTPPSPTPATTSTPQQQHIPSLAQASPTLLSSPLQEQPTQPTHTLESSMTLLNKLMETYVTLTQKVAHIKQDKTAQALETAKLKQRVKKLERKRISKHSGLKRGEITKLDADEDVTLVDVDTALKMDADIQGRVEEDVTTVKEVNVVEPTVFDDEEMQEKHLDNIKQYQSLKRKPISVAQARKNMIVYLNNMAGYKIQYFKGITYDQRHCSKKVLRSQEQKLNLRFSFYTTDTPTINPAEISEEDVQNMLQIIPMVEFKVEALQVKYPLIDWEIYSEGSRTYWRIIKVGRITQAYHSFEDMLKDFDREDLDALWRLVKERFSRTLPTVDKEKALWAELTRLYEPNEDDVFWKLQRYMHYPIMWKLHSNCGVHQVSSTTRRYDIYMLAEKDYPLSNQVMTLMLSSRLQVKEDSEVARDLVMKIFLKSNQPKSKSLDTSSN